MFKEYKIGQRNKDGKRHYEVTFNNEKYKLVGNTTLLSRFKDNDALFKWRERIGNEAAEKITNDASIRGTKVHKMAEKYLLKRELPPIDSTEQSNCFLRLKPILELIKPIALEKKVFWVNENKQGFAGTMDGLAQVNTTNFSSRTNNFFDWNDEAVVFDFKTWNKIKYPVAKAATGEKYYPLISYALQLAAYCGATNFCTDSYYQVNKSFIFGVTPTCKAPIIYYFSPEVVNWYWDRYKEILFCYYNNSFFDWKKMESDAEQLGYLGERIDYVENKISI